MKALVRWVSSSLSLLFCGMSREWSETHTAFSCVRLIHFFFDVKNSTSETSQKQQKLDVNLDGWVDGGELRDQTRDGLSLSTRLLMILTLIWSRKRHLSSFLSSRRQFFFSLTQGTRKKSKNEEISSFQQTNQQIISFRPIHLRVKFAKHS